MTKTFLMRSAFGAAVMAAACAATPALALEARQCAARTEIIQALQNEGQVEVISGQRTAIGMPRNIFTTNAQLSLGYNLEAGVGAEAGMICVAAKYTNVRLNSDVELRRPTWASFGPDTPHDRHLAAMESRDNDKVLMGADALIRSADGSEHAGPFLMVTRGNPAPGTAYRSAGEATVTTRNGGVTTLLIMANIDANDNFRTLARSRVQTASSDYVPSPRR